MSDPPAWRSRLGWVQKLVFLTFLLVGGYYLVSEHRAHPFGFLPYGILLLCPIMHLFMHKGHHHGRGHQE